MRGFFACLLLLGAGLGACAEQAPVEQPSDPWKREWTYVRFKDAIRGTTFVTATIGSNEADGNDGKVPAALLVIKTAAGGNEISVIDNYSMVPCMSNLVLVKIDNDPVDLVSCQGAKSVDLDPAMIPRIQRASRVVVEFGSWDEKRPLQVTFETANLQL